MFQSQHKGSGDSNNGESRTDLSFRADYYGGDFVEDGSFLVLSTDGLSLSPSTPLAPTNPNGDLEVIDEAKGDEAVNASASKTNSLAESRTSGTPKMNSLADSQVLGEDVESSVESSHSVNKQGSIYENAMSMQSQLDATLISMNSNATSVTSASTDAHLIETGEEVNLLVSENKKLTELLADSNEKMKMCISTTERLKADHEEYRKKHEASREVINQLRQDNEMLKSQVSMIQSRGEEEAVASSHSQSFDKEMAVKKESLQRQSSAIAELNDQLQTVLTFNGQLNEQLLTSQKTNDDLRAELLVLREERDECSVKLEAMKAEIEIGRQAIAKFEEHRVKNKQEFESARAVIQKLEAGMQEKTNEVEKFKRNMEDTMKSLERCNFKLNQKEQEVSILNTRVAAMRAETEVFERLQVLEMQCQSYRSDYEKVREEKAKLAAEKDALLLELNAANQQLKLTTDAYDNYRRQRGDPREPEFLSRNDNSAAANANEPLQSPLTSLPTVAGQLVGFVRRELLGWEDQAGASGDTNAGTTGGSGGISEAVVQQPKQEAIPPCPICRKTFTSLERLQTHASNCGIEADDNPNDPFVFP